LRSRSLGGC